MRLLLPCLLLPLLLQAADPGYVDLFNHRNLDGWEVVGDGLWSVLSDGTLVGQRNLKTSHDQSWLYTKGEFDEFDLRAEYYARIGGNSGISIRDSSRAHFAITENWVADKTPSHIGYEIQLQNHAGDPYPTGSVYLFDRAQTGAEIDNDWNKIEIQVRHSGIAVLLNGRPVSQSAGDPQRALTGPVGLQLHDPTTFILFKSIQLRSLGARR